MGRTFAERKRAAVAEFKAKYGEEPDYVDEYWFALTGRRTTPRERERIEAAGVLKPSDVGRGRDGKETVVEFTPDAVRQYLDEVIRYWRQDGREFAPFYVDAFQSVRVSLFGEMLGEEAGDGCRSV